MYGNVPVWCCHWLCNYYTFVCHKYHVQTYIQTMQPKPFVQWIEKGLQRDTNLCGAYAHPTESDERSLVSGGGVQPRFF